MSFTSGTLRKAGGDRIAARPMSSLMASILIHVLLPIDIIKQRIRVRGTDTNRAGVPG